MKLGLVRALFLVFVGEFDDVDAERHGARGQHVHDSVVHELDFELHFLEEATVAARGFVRVWLGFSTGACHFA